MPATHANIDKFKDGSKLVNKRRAASWIYDEAVPKLLKQVKPCDFKAFIMPSGTMFDIHQLRQLGVSEENMTVCERDGSTHAMLREQTDCDMFNKPTDLDTQIAMLGPDDSFHFAYFDMLGPISAELQLAMHSVANRAPKHFVLVVTVNGARENKYDQQFLDEMSKLFGIGEVEDLRLSVLEKMFCAILGTGKSDKRIKQRWQSEYEPDGGHGRMICYGAYYVS